MTTTKIIPVNGKYIRISILLWQPWSGLGFGFGFGPGIQWTVFGANFRSAADKSTDANKLYKSTVTRENETASTVTVTQARLVNVHDYITFLAH